MFEEAALLTPLKTLLSGDRKRVFGMMDVT
jgi:hypothetical protein